MSACKKCGKLLEGNEKFCPSCGLEIEREIPSSDHEEKRPIELNRFPNKRSIKGSPGQQKALRRNTIGIVVILAVVMVALAVFAGTRLLGKPVIEVTDTDLEIDLTGEEDPELPEQTAVALTGTQTIVGLFPLTGLLQSFGENSAAVARLAVDDVNSWLDQEDKDWRLNLEIEDTATDGSTAQRKMQHWLNMDVKFFIGPISSGAASECLPFANANQLLYISPSSTSPALSIADDWLFRFCADDTIQGPAIAAAAVEAGVEVLIFCWRGDDWGDWLQEVIADSVRELGIEIYERELRYDPTKGNFTAEIALLDEYVTDLISQGYELEQIGFNIIAFEEAALLMAKAADYPQLREISWIGSDGTALSEAILGHPVASQFAIDVKFINTMNSPAEMVEQSNYNHVRNHTQNTLNREIDNYSYITYDIIWAFAICFDEVGYDPVAVKEIMPNKIDEWSSIYSASGHLVLNEYGDRAFADYDYWLINNNKDWENVSYYDGSSGEVYWFRRVF